MPDNDPNNLVGRSAALVQRSEVLLQFELLELALVKQEAQIQKIRERIAETRQKWDEKDQAQLFRGEHDDARQIINKSKS